MISLLANLANKTGKTRSELIREALKEVYSQNDVQDAMQKISTLKSFTSFDFDKSSTRSDRDW